MKRRDFIKSSILLSSLGSCIPSLLFGSKNRFSFRNSNIDSDKIVVLIKLNGGNDGLNTVIPFQNTSYYDQRPSISIPSSESLPITDSIALHPSLENFQSLFLQQKMAIIQGVGYVNGNLSHFRSSDIWDTGSDENVELSTGWLGRLLELEYPDFPDNAPEHPLAIQFNSANLLEFKTSISNTGLYMYDPDTMYSIISGNYLENLNSDVPNTHGGAELAFVRELDFMSFNYSQIISEAAQNAPNTVATYPDTSIGTQLKITSRLISGGLSTPFYRLYQNGYDTHVDQLSNHSQLLYNLSSSLNVFINEMESIGLLDRILIVTTSEFGRRSFENASGGTDHGTSAPVFVFGSNINGGIFGNEPNLEQLDENNNLQVEFDFRQVYTSILNDWFGINSQTIEQVFDRNISKISFINTELTSSKNNLISDFKLYPVFPNPFNNKTTIRYKISSSNNISIILFNLQGKELKRYNRGLQKTGIHNFTLDCKNLSSGNYLVKIESEKQSLIQKISLVK